jgi:GNAT superfamily N-acetyltransferase
MTESEAALVAALSAIGRLPGASVAVDRDATWVASGRPLEGLNHVLRAGLDGDDAAIEARIDELDAGLRARSSVPATWWLGPSTTPSDLERRLEARGFTEADPEYGMVLDLGSWSPSSVATSAREVGASGDVAVVEDVAGLDDFLAVMAGAYGWSDDGRHTAWAELYRLPTVLGDPGLRHVVVRDGSGPVACASLFTADGHAFVTNVGTIPAARDRGLGTRATLAVLDIAARQGSRMASLTASRMGRGVYARIGFEEDALLRRRISPTGTEATP